MKKLISFFQSLINKNIYLKWNFEWRFWISDISIGIKNLITWFPIIYKDRNWDSHYIMEILKFKLKNQSKYIRDRDFYVNAKRDAEIMMTCVKLMELIQDDFYSCEYLDYQTTKYKFKNIPEEKGYSSLESKISDENLDNYFIKYPRIYKKVLNGEGPFKAQWKDLNKKKNTIAINIGYINHIRARKLLFSLLENNIEKWWV
jgi:hypothetical protein